jgi:hypothetical protein
VAAWSMLPTTVQLSADDEGGSRLEFGQSLLLGLQLEHLPDGAALILEVNHHKKRRRQLKIRCVVRVPDNQPVAGPGLIMIITA